MRVRIGVICPSRFEYDALKDLVVASHAAVTLSGMGKVRAACAVGELLRKNPGIQKILLIGFAGGLSGLEVGDVVEPDCVIEQDYCAEPFEKFPNSLTIRGGRLIAGSVRGTLLTQDRFLTQNPYAGSALARQHPRLACDMEGYAVAWACAQSGLECRIVKLISDAADETADHDFLKACRTLKPRLRDVLTTAIDRLSAA